MKTRRIMICPARDINAEQSQKTFLSGRGIRSHSSPFLLALSLALLLLTIRVQGRDLADSLPEKAQFRIGLGSNYIKTLDRLYSPLMYKSMRADLQLGYSKKSGKGIFTTDLAVFLGALKPNSGGAVFIYARETDIHGVETTEDMELHMSQAGVNLQVGYLHELRQLRSASKALYLGGSLEENLTYTPGFVNIGTINYGALNAKARVDYFLRNGKPIIFELALPVVSLVTRLPYHQSPGAPGQSSLGAFFTGNNKVETLQHFQNARFSIRYPFLVKKRIALDIRYEASWLHYYKPGHLTQAGSQLSLGLTF